MTKKTSIGGKLYTALVFIFLYAPIAVLIIFSFNSGKSTSVFEGFSLYWYKELFNDAATLSAFKNSMIVAVVSSIISTVMGTAAATGIYGYKNKLVKTGIMTVTNIPMMNPEIVTGFYDAPFRVHRCDFRQNRYSRFPDPYYCPRNI